MEIKEIHADIINVSKTQLSRVLSTNRNNILGSIYIEVGESEVKGNILGLFKYLVVDESEYTYKILKEFAEREKSKYLSSNLVEFMN